MKTSRMRTKKFEIVIDLLGDGFKKILDRIQRIDRIKETTVKRDGRDLRNRAPLSSVFNPANLVNPVKTVRPSNSRLGFNADSKANHPVGAKAEG